MNSIKKYIKHLTPMIVFIFALSGCSDNSSSTTSSDEHFGYISLTVTGAIDAVHECDNSPGCVVSFGRSQFEIGNNTYYTWLIESGDYTSFLPFEISTTSINTAVSRPSPGTYDIGSEMAPSFSAGYSNIEGGLNDDHSYETTNQTGGTLTIESSTNERVTGSFEFTAVHIDEGNSQTVTISGRFEAVSEDILDNF